MGNQKEEMKFYGSITDNLYHGVIHSPEFDLLSLRIPKSACSYLRRHVLQSHRQVVTYDELDSADKSKTYEIFESLPFTDTKFFSQFKDTPMIIFVREPLERCCSGVAELMNSFIKLPGAELPSDYFERSTHTTMLYKKYPVIFESMITDKISKADNLYELWRDAYGYNDIPDKIRENHLVPQVYWVSEIMKVKDNIVFFEVNDFLHDNVTHYISNHTGTNFEVEPSDDHNRANNSYDKPVALFTKSYLKAKICDEASNSPLRQSALEIYDKDIELYNSLKSKFYTLGQEEA